MKLKKIIIKKRKERRSKWTELTYQTHNPSNEIRITSQKTSWNKLWSLIFNQHNIKVWNSKKKTIKEDKKHELIKLISKTCDSGHDIRITYRNQIKKNYKTQSLINSILNNNKKDDVLFYFASVF
jgi:hypothetical protein